MLKRPLIYVNTAHHPLAVSATFCHEVGHHVSTELFGRGSEPVHFFFDADYNSHLEDPGELAADAVVSIAAYPEPIARDVLRDAMELGLGGAGQEASGSGAERCPAAAEERLWVRL